MVASEPAEGTVETLYTAHHRWLFGWLRQKLGCDHQAADLAQDTFVRLMTSQCAAPSLREPRAYLTRIAHGLMVNHWRRLSLERAYLDSLARQPEPLTPSPEQRALVLETLCQLDAMLDNLGFKVREAFLLSQLDGLKYAEIAERLGVSDRTIKKYMSKAMLQCLLIAQKMAP
ncbi:sigma-70 family RNA polymerase sigma factor [Achromobacter aloeverae]